MAVTDRQISQLSVAILGIGSAIGGVRKALMATVDSKTLAPEKQEEFFDALNASFNALDEVMKILEALQKEREHG